MQLYPACIAQNWVIFSLTMEKLVKHVTPNVTFADPSKIGEMHLKATCYMYVLQLRGLLLKQPSSAKKA